MPFKLKPSYFLISGALLIALMSYLSLHYWLQDNGQHMEADLKKVTQQAQFFAKHNEQQACFDKVVNDSANCRDGLCTMELKQFLAVCFESATPSKSFCDELPSAKDYFGKVSWSVSQCRKRKIKNANCPNIINQTALLCQLNRE